MSRQAQPRARKSATPQTTPKRSTRAIYRRRRGGVSNRFRRRRRFLQLPYSVHVTTSARNTEHLLEKAKTRKERQVNYRSSRCRLIVVKSLNSVIETVSNNNRRIVIA